MANNPPKKIAGGTVKSELTKLLQELRFTDYEARVYLALLEKSPLTGYGAALLSGVPRSKIYEVLGGLVSRGEVISSKEETPLYCPLPPAELVARRRRESERVLAEADRALKAYASSSPVNESIWNISGREAILDRVRASLRKARYRVITELWAEEAEELRDDFKAASERGVEVTMILDSDFVFDFATVYRHGYSGDVAEEYGGRWITYSADDEEVIVGIVSLGERSRAAWTMHPALIMPISEFLIHDVYVLEMLREFRPEMEKRFGPNLDWLRERFTIGARGKRYYLSGQDEQGGRGEQSGK